MTISIVIYRTPIELIIRCLTSIFQAIRYYKDVESSLDVEIYIINNGSECLDIELRKSEIYELLRLMGCVTQIIEGHGNIGYGAAHNLTLEKGLGDFQILMNPDVRLAQDSIMRGVQFLRSNPDTIAISPSQLTSEGERLPLSKRYPSVFDLFLRGFGLDWLKNQFRSRLNNYEMKDLDIHSPTKDVPLISGCYMLCRRSALRQVAGFDERYFLYFEDFDLSLRLGLIGKLAIVPGMSIEHDGGESAKKGLKHIFLFLHSAYKFFSTHGWKWY